MSSLSDTCINSAKTITVLSNMQYIFNWK